MRSGAAVTHRSSAPRPQLTSYVTTRADPTGPTRPRCSPPTTPQADGPSELGADHFLADFTRLDDVRRRGWFDGTRHDQSRRGVRAGDGQGYLRVHRDRPANHRRGNSRLSQFVDPGRGRARRGERAPAGHDHTRSRRSALHRRERIGDQNEADRRHFERSLGSATDPAGGPRSQTSLIRRLPPPGGRIVPNLAAAAALAPRRTGIPHGRNLLFDHDVRC